MQCPRPRIGGADIGRCGVGGLGEGQRALGIAVIGLEQGQVQIHHDAGRFEQLDLRAGELDISGSVVGPACCRLGVGQGDHVFGKWHQVGRLLEVLGQDYVRTARAKGLTERAVLVRHALKNALIPTITVAGLQVGYLMGGAVLAETVFARPGLGRLLVESIAQRNIPVVQTTIMLLSITFVLVNLVVDLLYVKLDPRIQYD